MDRPLMPKATAIWLLSKTALTFEQIALFCGLHVLEVKAIADEEVARGVRPRDPVMGGEVTLEDIKACENDKTRQLELKRNPVFDFVQPRKKGARYTPLFKRQSKPDAILWCLRYHPELSDSQIVRLVGTTRPTIESVRNRTHWNTQNIKPVDPVILGLCTQSALNQVVEEALKRVGRKEQDVSEKPEEEGWGSDEAGEEGTHAAADEFSDVLRQNTDHTQDSDGFS